MVAESSIIDQIVSFVNNYFIKESGIVLKLDTSFLDKGIIDSTGVIELVAYLETTFNIRVEDEEIIPDNLDSVSKLTGFVLSKLQNMKNANQ
jgi:acyl carrier protein